MSKISRFVRKPLGDLTWVDIENVYYSISPDKTYKIAFSHFQETTMGSYEGLFSLLNAEDRIIDNFEPLTASNPDHCCWTEDSNYFVVSTIRYLSGYLILKLPELEFAFIKMINPAPLEISLANKTLTITYNDKQVLLANSNQTYKGGILEIPSKKRLKPEDLHFELKNIPFYSRSKLANLEILTISDPQYRLDLIDGVFNEFNGKFPQNTKQIYNTRELEIYQLEAFAEYGDKKSQEWLDLIKQKTNNNYNRWTKVWQYIGFLER